MPRLTQRGYLLTGRSEYLEPYDMAMRAVRDDIAQLKKLTDTLPAQQVHLAMLEKMVDEDLVFRPGKGIFTRPNRRPIFL